MFKLLFAFSSLVAAASRNSTLQDSLVCNDEMLNSVEPIINLDQTLNLAQAGRKPVSSKYLTRPPICPLTDVARANIDTVQYISIDTRPNTNLPYLRQIRWNIQIPPGSTIEDRACNKHGDYVMSTALGINKQKLSTYKGLTVNYRPALDCNGSGYEPNLVLSLDEALKIADTNAKQGKNTVLVYSILGTYNTKAKIDKMSALADKPRTYVVMTIGNNDRQLDYCSLPIFRNKNIFIIGGTIDGNKLNPLSNIGPECVSYYLPATYTSFWMAKKSRVYLLPVQYLLNCLSIIYSITLMLQGWKLIDILRVNLRK